MDIIIIMMLFALAVVAMLLGWLPILNTVGKLFFSAAGMLLFFMLALLVYNAEIISSTPTIASTTVSGWTNVTGNNTWSNKTTTILYSTNDTLRTAVLQDAWIPSTLFVALGLAMMIRVIVLPFIMMGEAAALKDEEDQMSDA